MRLPATLLISICLGGCATMSRLPPSPDWLVGTWLMLQPGDEYPLACASGMPIRYGADGTYELFEEQGTWRLDRDRLTETSTGVTEQGDSETIGRPFVSRIERRTADEFRKTFSDGNREVFRRCPSP